MNSQTFDPVEPITILSFLDYFELACNTNGGHEGTATWLFHLFMKNPASAVLNACTCPKPKKKRRQIEGTITTYCEVVTYCLSAYSTHYDIAETGVELTTSKPPPNMNPVDYSQSLWLKALKCGSVYHESMLKDMFIEGPHGLIRHGMSAYWGCHKMATLQESVR